MKWPLRDYQRRFCRSVVDGFEGKVNNTAFNRIIGIGATGCGKTVIGATLVEHWTKRKNQNALFLVDSDELAGQTIKKLMSAADIIGDLEKAESRASKSSPAVVGSMQTMQKRARLERWRPDHFGLVIVDECHEQFSDGRLAVLNYFDDGGAKTLGITATPGRGDKRSLMRWYEHVACEIPMAELINARHLSPMTVETVPLEIRITSEIRMEDADNEQLGEELSAYYAAIIEAIEERAADRKCFLLFHPSIKASMKFHGMLTARGHISEHVDGTTKNRKEILEAFERGTVRFLNNADLLIKGYDCPRIDCLMVLRLCRSRSRYIQMVGRGTRLFCPHGCTEWCDHEDRKQDCRLLDFLWQCADHEIMGPADIFTDCPDQRDQVKTALRFGGKKDLLELGEFVAGKRERDLLEKLRNGRGRQGSAVDAVAFAAAMHHPELIEYEAVAPWECMPPSIPQISRLENAGLDVTTIRNRGHAAAIIDAYQKDRDAKKPTLKQVAILIRNGVENVHRMSFSEAHAAIDKIFSARRRPTTNH